MSKDSMQSVVEKTLTTVLSDVSFYGSGILQT